MPLEQREGKVLRPWSNAVHELEVACDRAGIERITVHGLRHTFGSWLVQRGISTFVVGRLMGHRDSTMVERFYGHLKPKTLSDAMAQLPASPRCRWQRRPPKRRVPPVCQNRWLHMAQMTRMASRR